MSSIHSFFRSNGEEIPDRITAGSGNSCRVSQVLSPWIAGSGLGRISPLLHIRLAKAEMLRLRVVSVIGDSVPLPTALESLKNRTAGAGPVLFPAPLIADFICRMVVAIAMLADCIPSLFARHSFRCGSWILLTTVQAFQTLLLAVLAAVVT